MMKNKLLTHFLAIACLIIFGSSCFFSTSSTTVKGYVRDGGGKPLADVAISFGGTMFEAETKSDAKGFFTVTAKHRPTQILRLTAKKDGWGMREKVEFPGFAAPTDDIKVEMIQIIGR